MGFWAQYPVREVVGADSRSLRRGWGERRGGIASCDVQCSKLLWRGTVSGGNGQARGWVTEDVRGYERCFS